MIARIAGQRAEVETVTTVGPADARLKRLLVNLHEQAADKVLRGAVAQCDGRVFPKVRVADVLSIDRSGVSDEEYRYALRAHFDFLVASAEGDPHFAVEFDEPYHRISAAAKRRDAIKDALCRRFELPLLRVGAQELTRYDQFTVLGWLAEAWFLHRWYEQEKAAGRIDYYDSFSPIFFYRTLPDGREDHPWDLGWEARRLIAAAWRKGQCGFGLEHVIQVPPPHEGYNTAYALLGLGSMGVSGNSVGDGVLIGEATLKVHDWVPSCDRDLVEGLSERAVGVKLRRYLRGEIGPDPPQRLAEIRRLTAAQSWVRCGSLLDDIPDRQRS